MITTYSARFIWWNSNLRHPFYFNPLFNLFKLNFINLEFTMKLFYLKHEIQHQMSYHDTLQQNAIFERKYQHLLSVTRALLFQSHLQKNIWAQALSQATYLINRLSSKFLKFKTPFHIFHKTPSDYSNTNVFGCLVFVSTHKKNITKPDPRSPKCIYLSNKHGFDLKFWGTRAS